MTLCKGFTLAESTAHTSRNDMNTFPRPTGEGLRERGLSAHDEIPKQVQHDKYVSEAHSNELNVLTSYRLNDFKKKAAFTLAEVLITLAIIGIVAAMTIPTLISDYRKKDTSARLKKFYSMMNQAIKLSEIDNGPAQHWQTAHLLWKPDGTPDYAQNKQLIETFITQYLLPYIKYSKVTDSDRQASDDGEAIVKKIYLNDGSTVDIRNGLSKEFFYDTNGDAKPNTNGIDIFYFNLATPISERQKNFGNENQIFGPYTYISSDTDDNYTLYDTREKALQKCKEHAHTCSNLLQKYDNFEFKDDYPY